MTDSMINFPAASRTATEIVAVCTSMAMYLLLLFTVSAPLSLPKNFAIRAESKFVESNCWDQVDFCPFHGPDAPFAPQRSYHEDGGSLTTGLSSSYYRRQTISGPHPARAEYFTSRIGS